MSDELMMDGGRWMVSEPFEPGSLTRLGLVASRDETRYAIMNVAVYAEGVAVATDGRRLALVEPPEALSALAARVKERWSTCAPLLISHGVWRRMCDPGDGLPFTRVALGVEVNDSGADEGGPGRLMLQRGWLEGVDGAFSVRRSRIWDERPWEFSHLFPGPSIPDLLSLVSLEGGVWRDVHATAGLNFDSRMLSDLGRALARSDAPKRQWGHLRVRPGAGDAMLVRRYRDRPGGVLDSAVGILMQLRQPNNAGELPEPNRGVLAERMAAACGVCLEAPSSGGGRDEPESGAAAADAGPAEDEPVIDQETARALKSAVEYVVQRIVDEPAIYYHMGHGCQAHSLLMRAGLALGEDWSDLMPPKHRAEAFKRERERIERALRYCVDNGVDLDGEEAAR